MESSLLFIHKWTILAMMESIYESRYWSYTLATQEIHQKCTG